MGLPALLIDQSGNRLSNALIASDNLFSGFQAFGGNSCFWKMYAAIRRMN